MQFGKKIGALAACVALLTGVTAGSIALIDRFAYDEAQDMANRQGLNGILHPAAVDSFATARLVGLFGAATGVAASLLLEAGTRKIRQLTAEPESQQPSQTPATEAYLREFVMSDIDNFRYWKALQNGKSDRVTPVEVGGRGTE